MKCGEEVDCDCRLALARWTLSMFDLRTIATARSSAPCDRHLRTDHISVGAMGELKMRVPDAKKLQTAQLHTPTDRSTNGRAPGPADRPALKGEPDT